MTNDLFRADATEQARLVRDGVVSPHAPVDDALRRIDAYDGEINAIVSDRRSVVRNEVDQTPAESAFRGVPIVIKDLGAGIAGEQMWNGSRVLKSHSVIAERDSAVVSNLRRGGFAILGRASTAEFGSTIATEPTVTGATRNPWNLDYSPGGSSGGPAAAVAAGYVPVAHGTDASGSIRIPASACGILGLKPTSGVIPASPEDRDGWLGIASTGAFARSVRDLAAVFEVMRGDPGTRTVTPEWTEARAPRLNVLVVDDAEAGDEQNRAALERTASALASLGHQVVRGQVGPLSEWHSFHRMFVRTVGIGLDAELRAWESDLGISIGEDDLDPSTRAIARLGQNLMDADRSEVGDWLQEFQASAAAWWSQGPDIIVTPVLATGPTRIGWFTDSAEGGRRVRDAMRFTPQWNVSGDPALVVPSHRPNGLPLGVQLVAPRHQDLRLLSVARDLERDAAWGEVAPLSGR